MSVLWWAEANGVFKYSSGAYRGRGNPLDAIPEPPKVGSTTSMPSKRFEETVIEKVAVTSKPCAFPKFACGMCEAEFVYEGDSADESGAFAPKFCPNCGRRNA